MVCTPQYTLMSRSAVERDSNSINYMSLIKSYHKKPKSSLTHLGSGCGSWHHSWTHWIAHSLWKFYLQAKESHKNVPFQRPRKTMIERFLWIHQKMLFVLKWEKKCMIRLASRDNSTLLFCNYAIKLEEKTENEKHDTFDGTCVQFETDNEHELIWSAITQILRTNQPQFIHSKSYKTTQTICFL